MIGLRAYKKYYNQYFRPIVRIDRSTKALTDYAESAPLKLKTPSAPPCIRA